VTGVRLAPTLFREYDVRGRVPEVFPEATNELSDEGMTLLGRAFGTLARERGRDSAVVGHDLRTYSGRLKDCFVRGLAAAGVRVEDLGCVLTPTLYFAQIHRKVPAGAMITASHNPQGWSGMKLATDYVTTLGPDDIRRLRAIATDGPLASGTGRVERVDVRGAYLADLIGRVKPARRLKVVLDCGNGTAALFAVEAFERAGFEVVPLYCEPDAAFPHHFPNPSETANRRDVRAKVLETGADLGLSFDGDGDRLGVDDERGQGVNADLVLLLLARQVLARRPGASVVFDVKCSQALVEDVAAHGGVPVMWKTGHSHIKAKMKETGAPIAGERSGHIFLKDGFHGFDDGLFAGLRLAEFVANEGKPLSALLATAPRYVTSPEIHVDCADEVKYRVVDGLTADLKRDFPGRVNDVNGARVSFADGWGLVRASSNLPELVLVFEGKDRAAMERIKAEFRRRLAARPEAGTTWHNE
jgi:phosphomannomutase/phosphoglucomutase